MKDENILMKLTMILRRCYNADNNIETRFYYCRYEIERLIAEIKKDKS